jgi:hypothetical protein
MKIKLKNLPYGFLGLVGLGVLIKSMQLLFNWMMIIDYFLLAQWMMIISGVLFVSTLALWFMDKVGEPIRNTLKPIMKKVK